MDFAQPLDFVAEKFDADDGILAPRRDDLHRVPADAERAAGEVDVVPRILDVDQSPDQVVAPDFHARPQRNDERRIILRVAETVDAGDAGDDDDVAPLKQRARRRVAQPVNLFVALRVFLNIHIILREIRFRLIIIEVRDKILHRVVREERLEFGIQLRNKRLVVRENQRRLLHALNHLRHRICFAGPGHAEQRLLRQAVRDALHQSVNRFRLIARR